MNSPRQFARSVHSLSHLTLITAALCLLLTMASKAQGQSVIPPVRPQQFLDTSYPSDEGVIINVPAGTNLQDALNSAKSLVVSADRNVTIKLPAGATFTPSSSASFKLDAVQTNGHWIIIRSDSTAFDRTGSIPPGMRVNGIDTSQTNQMVKIRATTNRNPAFILPSNANHYRLVGLDVGAQSNVNFTYQLIQLGSGGDTDTSTLPHDVIVDRCFVHGAGVNGINIKHAVTMNGNSLSVIDSYISDIHDSIDGDTLQPEDSQAISITNGQGPFKIVNNYLEAASENILIGGGDPAILNLVPSDIEIQRNWFSKPIALWRNVVPQIKNILELKNARRALINGNIFENMWATNVGDTAIVLTPRNQGGGAPWSAVQDVTFTNNIVRHVVRGMKILTQDNENGLSQPAARIQVKNNLFDDINQQALGGTEYGINITKGGDAQGQSFSFDHNTFILKGDGGMGGLVFEDGTQVYGLRFTNNITYRHILGGPNGDVGTNALDLASKIGGVRTWIYGRDVIVANTRGSDYPPNDQNDSTNYFPSTYDGVGFVNYSQGDYHLSPGSSYKNKGTDGKDIGCDIDLVNEATASAQSGNITVQLSATSYSVNEADGHAVITVNRSTSTTAASVDYATSDPSGLNPCSQVTGNASQRCDYAMSVGTLQFAVGESSKIIYIPIVDDGYVEGPETFAINLSNPIGASLGANTTATITVVDNDTTNFNPIVDNSYFVRQQYIDFLGREPDAAGLAGWIDVLDNCGTKYSQPCDRIEVSSDFFRSSEFQDRGSFVFRFYPAALGRNPNYVEFMPNLAKVSGFLTDAQLEANKVAFVQDFMNTQEFQNKYGSLTDTAFHDALVQTAGVDPGISFPNGTMDRAQFLRAFVESGAVYQKFYNLSFVVMQYFGYLRRDPDILYLNWLNTMNSTGDYRTMINGFMNSSEYFLRFGP